MKIFYLIAGLLMVALGFIGAFVPVLPTTPFLIVALMCFSRSSNRLHDWLIHHRLLGKFIKDWEEHRIIPVRAKLLASIMLCISTVGVLGSPTLPLYASSLLATFLLSVLFYIWHFPSSTVQTRRNRDSSPATPVQTGYKR